MKTVATVIDPLASAPPRLFSMAALLCFFPVVISFAVAPGAWWVDYPGILFHLAMFMLVAKLDAPDWAKAAGYGWLFLDVTTGVLTLNHVPRDLAINVRLGGHIFAGIWIATVSLSGSRLIRIVGVLMSALLFGYTFLSPFLPLKALSATSFLYLIWLATISVQNGTRRTDSLAGSSSLDG